MYRARHVRLSPPNKVNYDSSHRSCREASSVPISQNWLTEGPPDLSRASSDLSGWSSTERNPNESEVLLRQVFPVSTDPSNPEADWRYTIRHINVNPKLVQGLLGRSFDSDHDSYGGWALIIPGSKVGPRGNHTL